MVPRNNTKRASPDTEGTFVLLQIRYPDLRAPDIRAFGIRERSIRQHVPPTQKYVHCPLHVHKSVVWSGHPFQGCSPVIGTNNSIYEYFVRKTDLKRLHCSKGLRNAILLATGRSLLGVPTYHSTLWRKFEVGGSAEGKKKI